MVILNLQLTTMFPSPKLNQWKVKIDEKTIITIISIITTITFTTSFDIKDNMDTLFIPWTPLHTPGHTQTHMYSVKIN